MTTLPHHAACAHALRAESHSRRVHFWVLSTLFFVLGLTGGVWTMLVADLANALMLHPNTLGLALTSFSCVGIVLLTIGGYLADHVQRRLLALIGVGGSGMWYLALAGVSSFTTLLITLLIGGACVSCYDRAGNTLGGEYERRYASRIMTLLHVGFSGDAACGALACAAALADGIGFRAIYASVGAAFLLFTLAMTRLPLPPHDPDAVAQTDAGASGAARPRRCVS